MNLPDKVQISIESYKILNDSNSMEVCNRTQNCDKYSCSYCAIENALDTYESQIKPQIEALESRLKQAEEENERLREALDRYSCSKCRWHNSYGKQWEEHCENCQNMAPNKFEALGGREWKVNSVK